MPTPRRKFTAVQKMDILRQANELGVTKVLREHRISYSVFSRWKQQMVTNKADINHDILKKEIDVLLEENMKLKKIIANQALDLEAKREEILRIENLYRKRRE